MNTRFRRSGALSGTFEWYHGPAALTANKAARPRRKTGPSQRSLTAKDE